MPDDESLGDFEASGDEEPPDASEDSTEQEAYRGQTHPVDDEGPAPPQPGEEDPTKAANSPGQPDVQTVQARQEVTDLEDRLDDVAAEIERNRPLGPENPLSLDPRVGVNDLAFDRAKPGAKVYVVDVLAESVDDYYEAFPDAPALDEYGGNVLVRFRDADAVFACVYVKDSLTSVDSNLTAYPMPESRLTRYPAEQATMVGSASEEFERTDFPGGPALGTAEAIATTLSEIWGQNPQIPVGDTTAPKVVDALREEFDEETVREAVQRAGYEEQVYGDDEEEVVADGGVTEDDLREATEEFFDADDVDSVDYAPDRDFGMVVVSVEEEDAGFGDGETFDLLEFEETLNSHGFRHTGFAPAPGMTQVNVSAGEEE
jgi:hypothetical protein